MRQLQKRSSDRLIIKRPRPATTLAVSQYLRQVQESCPLSGLTCYEAEFVAKALAIPSKINKSQVQVLTAIHRKHCGLSWQDELEYFETDGGAMAL